MAYRPHGRAQVNPTAPRAFGRCDRCGFIYNHGDLRFQFDYRGPRLTNLRFLVCETCYDTPQPQLKPIMVTQDPLPVINMRPEDYNYANQSWLFGENPTTTDPSTGIPIPQGNDLVTEIGVQLEIQPTGRPGGLDADAVMPLYNTTAYNVVIPVLSISANGTMTVTVTCSDLHGLSTNSQVSVEGVANRLAAGLYSVTVLSATVFTYQTYSNITSGGLLTPTTRVATALVGLPPNDTQIPLTGAVNE
jgi:hypothetical protein